MSLYDYECRCPHFDGWFVRDADVSLLWKALEVVEQSGMTRAMPQAALLRA